MAALLDFCQAQTRHTLEVLGIEGQKFGSVFECASSDLEISHADCL
jgi:hypothetical protein